MFVNKLRLEVFTDGVLAIIMTLLVIEIKVPEIHSYDNFEILTGLKKLIPLFLSFFLSFAMIVNYWGTHHAIITLMAKNVNRKLAYFNFLFLAFVCITPFSSHLLGLYPFSSVVVIFYSCNVLIIALILALMRQYVHKSKQIDNILFSPIDSLYGIVRTLINIIFPIIAIFLAFWQTNFSIFLLVSAVILNIIPGLVGLLVRFSGFQKILVSRIPNRSNLPIRTLPKIQESNDISLAILSKQ